jgi:lipopolysaccharide/colanic/teichoic acid biosynthesis glycosyltransferase
MLYCPLQPGPTPYMIGPPAGRKGSMRQGTLWRGATLKWCLDVCGAGLLMLVLAPLMIALAIAIKVESPGPVLYRSRRVGYRGVEFDMLKFRKMSDQAGGPKLTQAHDPRFTRLGRFLASTKLDELPQLWNVIRGEMSLVGPRPEDSSYVAHQASRYQTILTVRPGLTGLSQLAFVRESRVLGCDSPETYYLDRLLPQKVGMDALYAERHTLWMDVRILAWTVAAMIGLDVAVNRDSGKLTHRRRVAFIDAVPAAAESEASNRPTSAGLGRAR